MDFESQKIQTMIDNQENQYHDIQTTISDLTEDCYYLSKALKEVLETIQGDYPELVLKYGPMIGGLDDKINNC